MTAYLNMKIVNRTYFLQMPAGTLFSKVDPFIFGPLTIKVCDPSDGWTNDFITQNIAEAVENTGSRDFDDKCELMLKGQDVPMDFDCAGRDRLFDPKQLFAVWSKEDVGKLIKRLQECL